VSRRGKAAKFVQITTTVDDGTVYLYALDEEGCVWWFDWDNGYWKDLSADRRQGEA